MIEYDARRMFEYSRSNFSGSLKSSNKVYSYEYGSSSDRKKTDRLNLSQRADNAIEVYRSRGYSAEDLLAKKVEDRAGNCGEMTKMALHYAALHRISDVWRVSTDDLGGNAVDHVFCVVGLPSSPPRLGFISSMASQAGHTMQAYVCDAWAGIVCPYQQYPHLFLQKMARWERQGKEIDAGWPELGPCGGSVRATRYGVRFMKSPADFVRFTASQL